MTWLLLLGRWSRSVTCESDGRTAESSSVNVFPAAHPVRGRRRGSSPRECEALGFLCLSLLGQRQKAGAPPCPSPLLLRHTGRAVGGCRGALSPPPSHRHPRCDVKSCYLELTAVLALRLSKLFKKACFGSEGGEKGCPCRRRSCRCGGRHFLMLLTRSSPSACV